MVDVGLVSTQIITGIVLGARLFLVAVGLSLIFGVGDVLNFTHGALFMIGSYIVITFIEGSSIALVPGLLVVDVPPLGYWPGLLAGAVLVGAIGVVIEAGFLRRIYDRDILDQLLLTFAFVLILTDLVRIVFGSGSKAVSAPRMFSFNVPLGFGQSVPAYRAFVVVMSVVVLGGIFLVLRQTGIGRLVRATSSDRDMASLLGVDVPRLYTGVFFVGSALAGFGGALAAPLGAVNPSTGNQVIIKAFVIAVIGGLGSFTGAFVGAMLVGILSAVGSLYVSGAGQLFPFLAMILVLVFRPQGLFGKTEEV